MCRYAVVVEHIGADYCAYPSDLPGCMTSGESVEETLENMRNAIALHLRGLREDGLPVLDTLRTAIYVEVAP
ncbi:MAG: type II toxin-antitoxin system HicB family antitoxin [Rhizobiaceae bacterium]|nr:MAG: type II toxin-antitoxin system HicB family antitoxin [Rhizobiaceae bacterium]